MPKTPATISIPKIAELPDTHAVGMAAIELSEKFRDLQWAVLKYNSTPSKELVQRILEDSYRAEETLIVLRNIILES